jgi:glycerol-1-phosphate dehydrogenase [NAD(P)+]
MAEYRKPDILCGRGIVADLVRREGNGMVCTMPEPWDLVRKQLDWRPEALHMVSDMAMETLEALEPGLPDCRVVYGIGGGSAADTAKFVAIKKQCRLVMVPTIISVDAFFTDAVGVRIDGRVRYIGQVWADVVAVDYDLIGKAPERLNRAGCADLLSIHTALHDWKLAAEAGEARYDEAIAAQARACLDRVKAAADEIGRVSQRGIDTIIDEYVDEVRFCTEFGGARPEEGSEHLFVYNYEFRTGKHMAHGELVGTGLYALSVIQGNDPDGIRDVMDRCRLAFRPKDNGITRDDLVDTLRTLNDFRRTYPKESFYSVLDQVEITGDLIERIVDGLS